MTAFSEFISGVILITSVIKIRRFMLASTESAQEVDVKTLTMHTLAFGLYLASITIYTIVYCIYLSHPNPERIMDTTAITQMIVYACSFIS